MNDHLQFKWDLVQDTVPWERASFEHSNIHDFKSVVVDFLIKIYPKI